MDQLTPGEKAYFESGGQDAAALLAENPTAASTPGQLESSSADGAAVPDAAAAAAAPPEAPEPGEEEIAAPDGKGRRRVVDSRALKAEREERRKLQAELQAERDLRARVDERLKMLSEAVSQPDPQEPATPETPEAPIDPNQDIFGAFAQQQREMAKLRETLTSLQSGQSEIVQQTQAERQTASMISTYRRDAEVFRAQKPDFNSAYNFLLDVRGKQFRAMGYDENEIPGMLYGEEMSLAQRALGMRQSPAAQIYALAQSMGYAPQPAQQSAAPAAGSQRTSAPAAPTVPSVTAEIDRIKAGQASSRSLSAGGGAAGEELSLEALADMPMEAFARFMNTPGNRQRVEAALGRRSA
ncbi:MAG TPA: hypothetical protein VEU47_13445 [Candidatus Cybelea sp.]|nr:hypothetical protein [Candidatus Cybelea sp.]